MKQKIIIYIIFLTFVSLFNQVYAFKENSAFEMH